jgi:5'-nucleotidase
MMRRPDIAIDLDDVLNDLVPAWIRYYNRVYGDDLQPEQVTDWHISGFAKLCTHDQFHDILTDPAFYPTVPVATGAIEALDILSKVANCYIVSAYAPKTKVLGPKSDWILANLPRIYIADVVFMNDKSRFKADYLIDDNPKNLQGEQRPLLIRKTWNIANPDAKCIPAFDDVLSAAQWILRRLER